MPMKTIWRYELLNVKKQTLRIPDDGAATPLCVQMRRERLTLWIEHYPNIRLKKEWLIWLLNTGDEVPNPGLGKPPLKYIGSVEDVHVYIDQYSLI